MAGNEETINLPIGQIRELLAQIDSVSSAEPDAGPQTMGVMRNIRRALQQATPRTMSDVVWDFFVHCCTPAMNLDTLDTVVMLFPHDNLGGRLIRCIADTGEVVDIAASKLVSVESDGPVHLQPSDRLFRFSPSPSTLIRTVDDYLACPPGTVLTADTESGGGASSTLVLSSTPEGSRVWLTMQGTRADDSMVAGVSRRVVVWGGMVSSQFVVPDTADDDDEEALFAPVRADGIYQSERDYLSAPVGECVVGSDGVPWVRLSRYEGWVNRWGEYLSHAEMSGTQRMSRPIELSGEGEDEIEVQNGDYWLAQAAGKRILVQRNTGSGPMNPWIEVGRTEDASSDAPSFSDTEVTLIGRIPLF